MHQYFIGQLTLKVSYAYLHLLWPFPGTRLKLGQPGSLVNKSLVNSSVTPAWKWAPRSLGWQVSVPATVLPQSLLRLCYHSPYCPATTAPIATATTAPIATVPPQPQLPLLPLVIVSLLFVKGHFHCTWITPSVLPNIHGENLALDNTFSASTHPWRESCT